MDEETRFQKHWKKHQKLLEIMYEYRDEDGICRLSQKELGQILNLGQTSISKYIKQINREEEVIVYEKDGYFIRQERIEDTKTFQKMVQISIAIIQDPNIFFENESKVSNQLGVKKETLQAVKALIRPTKKEWEKWEKKSTPAQSTSLDRGK